MFADRREAGRKLASALEKYKDKGGLVLALPRGGVEVGYEVAKYLKADFSILISRKLPFPDTPEAGFGALAEDGSIFLAADAQYWLPKEILNKIIKEQRQEIKRRIAVLRKSEPLPELNGRTVILVDDGIAMGSTMRAAIMLCQARKAKKIIVAVPVSGKKAAEEIRKLVDEMIVLEKPEFFQAVAQVYQNWYDVSDTEVLEIMEKWQSRQ